MTTFNTTKLQSKAESSKQRPMLTMKQAFLIAYHLRLHHPKASKCYKPPSVCNSINNAQLDNVKSLQIEQDLKNNAPRHI
jgi:hypothetical protein